MCALLVSLTPLCALSRFLFGLAFGLCHHLSLFLSFRFTSQGILPSYTNGHTPLASDFQSKRMNLPKRSEGNQLQKYSKVLGQTPFCHNLDFQRFNQSEHVPSIQWPAKRVVADAAPLQKLLFREGQSRTRPPTGSHTQYGFVVPFFLGVGSVLIVIIVYMQVTKSKRASSSTSNVVPAHL